MIEDSDAQASVPCPRTEITDTETVVEEVFARETRHKHGMLAWPGTQALKNLVLAAEERGRRAGIEEIQVIVSNALTEWPCCYDGLNYVLQRLRDLALRDSGHEACVLTDDNATRITAPKDRK